MADMVQVQFDSAAANLYAVVRNSAGLAWNGTTFETYVTANLGNYDLPMTEQGTASRYYAVAFPSTIAAGIYAVTVFQRVGGSPAETDTPLTGGSIDWDGTNIVPLYTRLAPTTAGRTLDVTAANKVNGVVLVDTLTTYTGNTLQTGDSFARIGATGSGLTALSTQASVDTIDDFIDTELAAVLAAVDTEVAAIKAKTDNLPSSPAAVGSAMTLATDAVSAAALAADAVTEIQAGIATAANLAVVAGYLDTEVAAIKGVTDKLDTAVELDGAVYRFTTNALEQAPTSGGGGLDAAGVRAAVGLAAANLDTQLADLPTNGELASALGTADDAVLAQVALVKAKTDTIPASPAAIGSAMTLTSGERDAVAAALLDLANGIETSYTPRQALRLMLSALAAKLSGAAGSTVIIRDVGDTKPRITASVDADGNRTAVTLDAT